MRSCLQNVVGDPLTSFFSASSSPPHAFQSVQWSYWLISAVDSKFNHAVNYVRVLVKLNSGGVHDSFKKYLDAKALP